VSETSGSVRIQRAGRTWTFSGWDPVRRAWTPLGQLTVAELPGPVHLDLFAGKKSGPQVQARASIKANTK
jgi:hypothetical protein